LIKRRLHKITCGAHKLPKHLVRVGLVRRIGGVAHNEAANSVTPIARKTRPRRLTFSGGQSVCCVRINADPNVNAVLKQFAPLPNALHNRLKARSTAEQLA
jgi:hypothetical protein